MKTIGELVEIHYNQNTQEEWKRLERHRTEFAITKRTLQRYLPQPPCSIIDIGSGPGRYAIDLSELGYRVSLVDISQKSLDFARQKAADAGVQFHGTFHSNALGLDEIGDDLYHASLLLGPLYHLLYDDERKQAVKEAHRVLKTKGRIFAAFITRFAPFHYSISRDPEWVLENPEYAMNVLVTGVHDQGESFPQAYFTHPEEIAPFMESLGFETLFIVGCEGIASRREELINQLEGDEWETWVDLNFKLGQERTLWGASEHVLYVGQKSG